MRLLFLTQVLPYPPDSGPKIKTHNVLRFLARHHEVHLVSFVRSAQEEQGARFLEGICASVTLVSLRRSRLADIAYLVASLGSGRPFLVERDRSAAMRAAVSDLLVRYSFDAVHADQLTMAQFAIDLPLPLRVLDEHNAVWSIVRRAAGREGLSLRRLATELEWRKLRGYEGRVCRRFDRVLSVSTEDLAALEQAAGTALRSDVIPIAVDAQATPYSPPGPQAGDVVSVATMFYPPNVEGVEWFGRAVWPTVARQAPAARFFVVGARPPASIRDLARSGGSIVVTGYVGDLEPILSRSAVLVVPLRVGSGMRVKILEALARGLPVVSTTLGVEGIDVVPGMHLLVADQPDEFARAVIRLLTERDLAERLARSGRTLVENRYDWHTALSGLDRVYSVPTDGVAPTSVADLGWR
jgi:polysaccharide biosynthesis protein PslH